MKTLALLLGASGLLAGCSQSTSVADNVAAADGSGVEKAVPPEGDATPPANRDTPIAAADARYVGRWIGVEGMYLNISARPGGGVVMDMQWDLDSKGEYDGTVTAEGLRFMRGGVPHTAVRTDGNATGLKYLAGKKDCLTVKPGEGYCRD